MADSGTTNVSTAMNAVMGLALTADSSSGRASPGEPPRAGSSEDLSNWPSVRDVNLSGSSRYLLDGDAVVAGICTQSSALMRRHFCIFGSLSESEAKHVSFAYDIASRSHTLFTFDIAFIVPDCVESHLES